MDKLEKISYEVFFVSNIIINLNNCIATYLIDCLLKFHLANNKIVRSIKIDHSVRASEASRHQVSARSELLIRTCKNFFKQKVFQTVFIKQYKLLQKKIITIGTRDYDPKIGTVPSFPGRLARPYEYI